MNLAGDADLVIGVDTHLDTHTAALCDARGRALSRLQVPATAAGYAQLLAWARSAAAGGRARSSRAARTASIASLLPARRLPA